MSTSPALGDLVLYTLTQDDADLISSRRMAQPDAAKGNPVQAGHTYPAFVVAVFETGNDDTTVQPNTALGQTRYAFEQHPSADGHVNLHVILDGYDSHWVTDAAPASDDENSDTPADAQPGTYTARG